jgi:hypothetical protein
MRVSTLRVTHLRGKGHVRGWGSGYANNALPCLDCPDMTPAGGYPAGGQTSIDIRNEHMQYILTWCAVQGKAPVYTGYIWRQVEGCNVAPMVWGTRLRSKLHAMHSFARHRYSLCALTSFYCYNLIRRRWR